MSKQIKKLKLANKQADIQAFLLPLHSKPPFPKQRFRKITSKRNCKIIEIWSSLEAKRNKKIRYINKKCRRISVCKTYRTTGGWRAHNSWWTFAQQLICKRTTAVVRFTIVYSPTTDTISSNNLSYIFQQLMPVLSAPLPISINTPIHFREQTEAHQYRTAKAWEWRTCI